MPHCECYYHIVWATKHRQPLIIPDIEPLIISTIKRKSQSLECPVYAINGIEDHIHVAVTIVPKVSVAEWVRQVKGLSTRETNAHFPDAETSFQWQTGYSVHTVGKKALPFVVGYIRKQKEHHKKNTIEPYLEYIEPV